MNQGEARRQKTRIKGMLGEKIYVINKEKDLNNLIQICVCVCVRVT